MFSSLCTRFSRAPNRLALLLLGLLLVVRPGHAQTAAELSSGVVKITSTSDGVRRTGTGFIVQTNQDAIYIATASHVVEGDKAPKVAFHADPNSDVVTQVVKIEGGDPKGLALLVVRNDVKRLLRDVQVLQLSNANDLSPGESVTAIGFPQGGGGWAVVPVTVASRDGRDLVLSGNVAEGNSGGPIIKDGNVVGLVTGTQGQYARATPAVIVRFTMEGWGVKPGAGAARAVPPASGAPDTATPRPSPGAAGNVFRIASIDNGTADPSDYSGVCPAKIKFSWTIRATDGPGKITYQVLRSDGVISPAQTLEFKGTGSRSVVHTWNLGRPETVRTYDGSATLQISAPQAMQSEPVEFHVECRGQGASGGGNSTVSDSEDAGGPGPIPPTPPVAPPPAAPGIISVKGQYQGQLQGVTALGQTQNCGFNVAMTQQGVSVTGDYSTTCGDQGSFIGELAENVMIGVTISGVLGGYCELVMEVADAGAALNGKYGCQDGEQGVFSMKRK